MRQQAEFFTLALWWGALTVVGFGVVPLLFANLETPQAAGRMAAVLFSALNWLGWACAAVLLASFWSNRPVGLVKRAQTATVMIVIAVCASLLSHWLVAPHIVARENLKLWHSLGSILYLVQWLGVTILFWLRIRASSNLLTLRGAGADLWESRASQTVANLRDEWGDDHGPSI